uniref:Uncharacterized protein n=1 Tax=Setaria viridis TaxID=4556 RepID=A0A4U6U6G0_SETVI|nr:hypothetical protein SEVIR_6G101357v2 [Setaria viridis]
MEFISSSSTPWCGGLHESDVGSVVFPNSDELFHRHCSSLAEGTVTAPVSPVSVRAHAAVRHHRPCAWLLARPPPPAPPTRSPAAPEPRQADGQELHHAPAVFI